jgi:hypothetical protein
MPDDAAPGKLNLYVGKTAVKIQHPGSGSSRSAERLDSRTWQMGRACTANRTGSCFGFATLNRLNRKSLVTM